MHVPYIQHSFMYTYGFLMPTTQTSPIMPPQQGYISRQFEALEDGGKTPMAKCRHCDDKRVARNIVARKIVHLSTCDAYYTHLQQLLDDETTDAGAKELRQMPPELKAKIEERTEQPLITKSAHAAAETANQESIRFELESTLCSAIYHGSLPFDAFEPDRHPDILRLCRMVVPDYVPPTRSRIAQSMMVLANQPDIPRPAPPPEPDRDALSSRIADDLIARASPYSTPGSKRPFDLV